MDAFAALQADVRARHRASHWLVASPLLLLGHVAAASADPALAQLQQLNADVKHAINSVRAGENVGASEIEGFRRGLAIAGGNSASPALADKAAAVGRLLGELDWIANHSANRAAVSAPRIDRESIADGHGDSCSAALGAGAALPVRVTLAHAGSNRSQAWFRVEPTDFRYRRIATDSDAADPVIEVFAACGAPVLARNDDSLGLDAAVALESATHAPLFVHVVNSGSAGSVTLEIQDGNETISGKITDEASGQPISGANILLFTSVGNWLYPQAYTDANGNYTIAATPGGYYVRAVVGGHVSALYPAAQCRFDNYYYSLSDCPTGQAQLVTVSAGASVTGIDLALDTGFRIAGTIRDGGGTPTAGNVYLYDGSSSAQIWSTNSDNFGRYVFATLPAGTYKVLAAAPGYGSQWYDHVTCTGPLHDQCTFSAGTTITIVDHDLGNADFNLPALAAIEGSVLDQNDQVLVGYNTRVDIVDPSGTAVAGSYTDNAGNYHAGPLPAGTYYAYASSWGYFPQLYDGVDCGSSCLPSLASGAPLVVADGQVLDADFRLDQLPVVHGHVQDAVSGLPIANVQVLVSATPPATFSWITSAITDTNGDYLLQNTPVGNYYLWAQSDSHIDQVYPAVNCEAPPVGSAACDVSAATLLHVAVGQVPPAFDFALPPASSVSGKVLIDAGPGSDLPASAEVDIFNGAGLLLASTTSDSLGNYTVGDIPPGNVYAIAGGTYWYNYDWVGQIWPLMNCTDTCVPTTGVPIPVGADTNVGGIDFRLVARHAVVGRVTDSFGAPITNALVDLFDKTSLGHLATGITNTSGYYYASYYTGSYFVATDADGYIDQVYSGIVCPLGAAYFGECPFTGATAVTLDMYGLLPRIVNFSLTAREIIFSNGFE